MKLLEVPGGSWRFLEVPGGSWRFLEVPGNVSEISRPLVLQFFECFYDNNGGKFLLLLPFHKKSKIKKSKNSIVTSLANSIKQHTHVQF